MLSGEVFGAPDALLPGSVGHRAIMGLRLAGSNCKELHRGVQLLVDSGGAAGL
jgi:UDP-N-acetylenolpyruvoylglucosamine reductase